MKLHKGFMMALCLTASLLTGPAALAQSGQTQKSTLRGAGLGALVGQAIGHDTGSTVAGAVVGAGVGHVVGKKKEQEQAAQAAPTAKPAAPTAKPAAPAAPQDKGTKANADDPAQPLYNSFWQVESILPKDRVPAFFSKVVQFLRDGTVQTLTTSPEGKTTLSEEPFSAVGDTLVIDRPENAVQVKFKVDGDRLILSAEDFSAVLNRVNRAGE